MKTRTFALAAAALALVASPVLAQASFERASAPTDEESELAGGAGIAAALIGVAAVVGGIIALSDDDDPVSA